MRAIVERATRKYCGYRLPSTLLGGTGRRSPADGQAGSIPGRGGRIPLEPEKLGTRRVSPCG